MLSERFDEKQSVVQTLPDDSHCHSIEQLGLHMLMRITILERTIDLSSWLHKSPYWMSSFYLPQLCESTA